MWRSQYTGLAIYSGILLVLAITIAVVTIMGIGMAANPVAAATLSIPMWMAVFGCLVGAEVVHAYRSIAVNAARVAQAQEEAAEAMDDLATAIHAMLEQQRQVAAIQAAIRDDLAVQHTEIQRLLVEQCQYLSELVQDGEE